MNRPYTRINIGMAITGAVILVFLAAFGVAQEATQAPGDIDTQDVVDPMSCLAANCHAYRMAFRKSPHSVLDTENIAAEMGASSSCAACHGEPIPQAKIQGQWTCDFKTFGFNEEDPPLAKSQRCLVCHSRDHSRFSASPHSVAGLACNDCHDVHGADRGRWPLQRAITVYDGSSLQSAAPFATCAACHADVFAEFEFADRHRLQEGILDCTSCHDPHEPQSRMSLGGMSRDSCSSCHTSKDGPFMYEHGASLVEGCTSCHDHHGSPNRHMLKFQNVAELCYSCHFAVPGFHSRFTLDTQCTNCHPTIHGSQLDPYFLK